jgi:hypothetical protein
MGFGNRAEQWFANRVRAALERRQSEELSVPISMHLRNSELGDLLLRNSTRSLGELAMVAHYWDAISATPEIQVANKFQALLEHARALDKYPNAKVPGLALEAARNSNIGPEKYAEIEADYLKSLAISEPFSTDMTWQDGNYVAGFLGRADVRRLFMSEHTNSCMGIGKANEEGIRWLQNSPDGGMFAVWNAKTDEIIAASRVWKGGVDGESVCFNSIQSKGAEGRDSRILGLYRQAASHLINEENYKLVTIGNEHNKVNLSSLPLSRVLVPLPLGFKGLEDCTCQQLLLARK